MDRKIILFELNEVPMKIVECFRQWCPKSNLARRLSEFKRFETYSEDKGHLSPWVTWPTLHRGVINERHLIQNFGQNLGEVDQEFPPIWKLTSKAGVSTGICGTLHTYPPPENMADYSFYLPDTFAAGSECFPKELEAYQDFNLTMARESMRNVSGGVAWKQALKFLANAPGLGLKPQTVLDIGSHLVSERMQRWKSVRRRTYQVVLAFDIFMKQLRNEKPAFCSFFTNHVASSMHRYWAAKFPDDYGDDPFDFEDSWIHTYHGEIEYTMSKFDQWLGRLMRFVEQNNDYQLWVTTSMGQAAHKALSVETQLCLKDRSTFMEKMGLSASDWESRPAMFPQFAFIVGNGKDRLLDGLNRLKVKDEPLTFRESEAGFFSLDFGHINIHDDPGCITYDGSPIDLAAFGLEFLEIDDLSGSTAYHIPEGCLFVFDPKERSGSRDETPNSISTLDIAPTILDNYSIPIPEYMNSPVAI